jgi:acyl-CoA synthetase (NDP forming)
MGSSTIIAAARKEGRTLLNEIEAKQLLQGASIPVTETRLATSANDAVRIAEELGFPVALKVVSAQVAHKSDVGGVKLHLASQDDVRTAYGEIEAAVKRAAPDAAVDGVSVQPMADPGLEVIVGMTTDPQFGPVLMFGLGGVLVEVLKDVSFRVVPLAPRDAKEMVREIQGAALLGGYRGRPPADVGAIESVLMAVSSFSESHPEVVELDLNPVVVYAKGAVAVDARIVIREGQ